MLKERALDQRVRSLCPDYTRTWQFRMEQLHERKHWMPENRWVAKTASIYMPNMKYPPFKKTWETTQVTPSNQVPVILVISGCPQNAYAGPQVVFLREQAPMLYFPAKWCLASFLFVRSDNRTLCLLGYIVAIVKSCLLDLGLACGAHEVAPLLSQIREATSSTTQVNSLALSQAHPWDQSS